MSIGLWIRVALALSAAAIPAACRISVYDAAAGASTGGGSGTSQAGGGGASGDGGGATDTGGGGMSSAGGGGAHPVGWFPCGDISCRRADQYCFDHAPIADGPSSSECRDLPACGETPCDCATSDASDDDCEQSYCHTVHDGTTFTCLWI